MRRDLGYEDLCAYSPASAFFFSLLINHPSRAFTLTFSFVQNSRMKITLTLFSNPFLEFLPRSLITNLPSDRSTNACIELEAYTLVSNTKRLAVSHGLYSYAVASFVHPAIWSKRMQLVQPRRAVFAIHLFRLPNISRIIASFSLLICLVLVRFPFI